MRVKMAFELPKILSEQAPDRLQKEVATHVRARGEAVAELVIEPGHEADRLSGNRLLRREEDRLAFRKEHERVNAVGQIDEVERGARLRRVRAWFPVLEATERTAQQSAVRARCELRLKRCASTRGLIAVSLEALGLARMLHLD